MNRPGLKISVRGVGDSWSCVALMQICQCFLHPAAQNYPHRSKVSQLSHERSSEAWALSRAGGGPKGRPYHDESQKSES